MAKQIKRTDIVEDDIFKVTRDSAKETLEVLDKLNTEFKTSAKVLSEDIRKATLDSAKGIETFVKSTERATKLKTDSIRVDEQTIKIKQQLAKLEEMEEKRRLAKEKADGQAISNAQKLQKEEERKAKAIEKAAKAAKDESSAYKQLEKNTRELKNQSKELAAQMLILEKNGQKNSKQYRELASQYKNVTSAAQQGDQALKKIDSTVGDNFRNVGNYSGAVSKLSGLLGQLGIAFGFGAIAQKTVKVLASFDEGAADMAKTLNITTDEARKLSKELLNIDTRTSVENLQQIAAIGGQLGISSKDIVGFTQSVDKLNVALGDEFSGGAEEITSVVGGLRNVFSDIKSDNVSEDLLRIGNALNVLGAEGSATSPVMSDFAGRIGGVGIPLGLTTDQVLGLSATLQELNVNAERGGTAVGNILKKMAQDTEGFAKFAGVPLKEFEKLVNTDIFAAFEKVVESTKKYKGNSVGLAKALDALKLDGAGASEVFLKLGSNMNLLNLRTDQANKSLKNTDSIVDEFNKKNETLQAKIDKLKNAFDKYILGIDESGFATGTFGKILDFLSKNLSTIISLAGKAVVAWGAYKAILLAVQAKQYLFNGGLKNTISGLTDVFKSTKKAAEGAEDMAHGVQSAGKAMNAIPWMLIIGAVIELATAFWDVASGAARAREQAERLDNYRAKASETAQKNITKETEALDKQLKQRQRDLEIAKSKAKTETEKQRLEKESLKLQKQDILNSQKQVRAFRDETVIRLKSYRAQKAELEELTSIRYGNRTEKQQNRINQIYEELGVRSWTATEKMKDAQDILTAKITAAGTKINEYNDGLETMDEMLNDTTTEIIVQSNAEENDTDKKNKKTKAVKELNTEMEKYTEYLTIQNQLLAELDQLQTEGQINQLTTEIEKMTEELQMLADGGINADTSMIEAKIQQRYDLEKQLIQQKLDAEIAAINERYRIEAVKAREAVTENYQKLISQKGLSTAERLKIENQYQEQLRLLDQDELQRNADKELELKVAKERSAQDQLEIEKNYDGQVEDLKNDLNDRILASEENRIEREDEAKKKQLEKEKQNAEDRIAIINAIAEAAIAASQRRVEQIEKEIQAAQSQVDYFKELAAQGNIDAKESLAEQNKIIAEANQRKEAELRKQQRIQFANTVYQTYQKNSSDENVKNPLAKTITDVTLLAEFIKNFPAFLDGTEDTGTNGQGVDGKGGFHAILHPNERVMTKEQNSMVGDLSNESLAKLAQEYNAGNVIHKSEGAVQLGGAWSTAAVIKKLDELENAVKSKPETNIELGEIIDGAMTIIKSRKQGNSVVYNRYKVK